MLIKVACWTKTGELRKSDDSSDEYQSAYFDTGGQDDDDDDDQPTHPDIGAYEERGGLKERGRKPGSCPQVKLFKNHSSLVQKEPNCGDHKVECHDHREDECQDDYEDDREQLTFIPRSLVRDEEHGERDETERRLKEKLSAKYVSRLERNKRCDQRAACFSSKFPRTSDSCARRFPQILLAG
jgi:hypothetical protein